MSQLFIRPRHSSGTRALAWFLSTLLLAQTFIPLQSHTRFSEDENVRTVLICTLAGTKTISLNTLLGRDTPVDGSDLDENRNPTMLFSQLLADKAFDLPSLTVRPLALLAVDVDETSVFFHQVFRRDCCAIAIPRTPDTINTTPISC